MKAAELARALSYMLVGGAMVALGARDLNRYYLPQLSRGASRENARQLISELAGIGADVRAADISSAGGPVLGRARISPRELLPQALSDLVPSFSSPKDERSSARSSRTASIENGQRSSAKSNDRNGAVNARSARPLPARESDKLSVSDRAELDEFLSENVAP